MCNLVYLGQGAIGDFLMILNLCDAYRRENPGAYCFVVTTRNAQLLREFSSAYSFVKVISLEKKYLWRAVLPLLHIAQLENIIIIPPSFGGVSKTTRFLARILAIHKGSQTYCYKVRREHSREINCDNILTFNPKIPFFKNLLQIDQRMSIKSPHYQYIADPKTPSRFGLHENDYFVVHPFAGNPQRTLPFDRWVNLLEFLIERYPKRVVIIGSTQEQQDAEKIASFLNKDLFLNLCGTLKVSELTTLIDHARVFIGADSGLTHLAGVLGKPSVVIGNNSNPTWLPVYNKYAVILKNNLSCTCDGMKGGNCLVEYNGRKYYRCMLDIPQSNIKREAIRLFETWQEAS